MRASRIPIQLALCVLSFFQRGVAAEKYTFYLTEEEMQAAEIAFISSETSGDDLLCLEELENALEKIGLLQYAEGDVDSIFNILDKDQDGKIGESEFLKLVYLGIVFRLKNFDKTGYWPTADTGVSNRLLIPPASGGRYVKKVYVDGNGFVNLTDFVRFIDANNLLIGAP